MTDLGFFGAGQEIEVEEVEDLESIESESNHNFTGDEEDEEQVKEIQAKFSPSESAKESYSRLTPSLLLQMDLENHLSKDLYPSYNIKSDSSHTILVALLASRSRTHIKSLTQETTKFNHLFTNTLTLLISKTIALQDRQILLRFLIALFGSLEIAWLRGEVMGLVGIGSWCCLTEQSLAIEVAKSEDRARMWARAQKKLGNATGAALKKIEIERAFMSKLIAGFFGFLESDVKATGYCEIFVEFLIDLEAQLPTRRFFHVLIRDHLVISTIRASTMYERESKQPKSLFLRLLERLEFCVGFGIDEITGVSMTAQETAAARHSRLAQIQKMCFIKFPSQMEEFVFASVGSLENSKSVTRHLEGLDEEVLNSFADEIGVRRIGLDGMALTREFLIGSIVSAVGKPGDQLKIINEESLYPEENCIFDDARIPNNFASNVLVSKKTAVARHAAKNTSKNSIVPLSRPLPKLNIQFLTFQDYLIRNFELYKLEAAYSIRQDIQDAVLRLNPCFNPDSLTPHDRTIFRGWSRMATPLNQIQIEQVGLPRLTETVPAFVKADITYSLDRYNPQIAEEWDSLRLHDTLLLISIQMLPDLVQSTPDPNPSGEDFRLKYGIKSIRGCEIFQILGDDGAPVYDFKSGKEATNTAGPSGAGEEIPAKISTKNRTIRVLLDSNQYYTDLLTTGGDEYEVYGSFNVVLRRNASQNNYKSVLESIRDLMQTSLVVPEWIHNHLLGYNSSSAAPTIEYSTSPSGNAIDSSGNQIDFGFTFLNWKHLVKSFPEHILVPLKDSKSPTLVPPFFLTFPDPVVSDHDKDSNPGEKRKATVPENKILVKSYRMKNLKESPKVNKIEFTPVQVEAIRSGSSNGLTIIVGPPGTGKTDVAVQIISNIYNQNPNCHMLLITRSNQALNHLFEKITNSNIDSRHLLRLGHGHEDLQTKEAWGKVGRVNSFLELRIDLLEQVEALALSLNLPKDHASSCETASYFFSAQIIPLWHNYINEGDAAADSNTSADEKFPFSKFISKIFPSLFIEATTPTQTLRLATEYYAYITAIFSQLEKVRPFELLRTNKDRSNYLLVKEARIIAMTSTHASLKRRELIRLGFKYDTVIMEEAGQMLEVETFIPLLLQSHDTDLNSAALGRVVLIGDHHQLPPIVQNMTLAKYAGLDQSLFARMVRLDIPRIELDYQGRARGSIADLYRWNYPGLKDLKLGEEYGKANAGLAFEFQCIDVGPYNGVGESLPRPHFVQNLGEAEYVVGMYMYMRLLGYPASKIAILTTYNGQRELILDVLERRCRWKFFGLPVVSTVDRFQGQQADFILLSLVRTEKVGHVRDVRRLIVALSRARLGLYLFCRTAVFKGCEDISGAFNVLMGRTTRLMIVEGEKYGESTRGVATVKGGKAVKDVIEMGKIVLEMSKTLTQ